MLGVQKPCGAESDLTGLQSVDFDILPKGFGRGEGHARVLSSFKCFFVPFA